MVKKISLHKERHEIIAEHGTNQPKKDIAHILGTHGLKYFSTIKSEAKSSLREINDLIQHLRRETQWVVKNDFKTQDGLLLTSLREEILLIEEDTDALPQPQDFTQKKVTPTLQKSYQVIPKSRMMRRRRTTM